MTPTDDRSPDAGRAGDAGAGSAEVVADGWTTARPEPTGETIDGRGRPRWLVVVLGTGTEVGKTWVAARVLERLRAGGLTVAARKPAQSSAPGDVTPSDADVLAAATGEDPARVCPAHRRYEVAMAPPMAAEVLGRPPFTVADLADEITWPPGVDLGLLETAGGVLSPAAAGGTSLDLARALDPDRGVLVADAGLGTVNAVRLSRLALAGEEWPLVVVLNRFDGDDRLHRANREALAADGADLVITVDELVDRWRTTLDT